MLVIATVGPSIYEKKVLKDIIDGGADALRFNFSHGDLEGFNRTLQSAREIKKDIFLVQDLMGSKIRVSNNLSYIIKIYNGEEVIFCGEDVYRDEGYKKKFNSRKVIPLNFKSDSIVTKDIFGISMKDNTMQFDIISINEKYILTKVIRGRIVRGGKGCNLMGFDRSKIGLSEKDKADINWALDNNISCICQSFVEEKDDIEIVKSFVNDIDKVKKKPLIWAKIETPKGIKNIVEIANIVDGILIGRGDLIPESSIDATPIYQDEVFKKMRGIGKDLIIGTHVLNSMKNGRTAELPEVEAIYNNIKQGATGFLLAGETSVGKAPIRTVQFLRSLVDKYEKVIK